MILRAGRATPKEQERGHAMNADQRRQLKNEYRNKPAVGAVYAIDCSGNQRRWIKSTVDLEGIKNRFRFAISIQGSPDPAMNNEWKQYGAESFSLVVLEELKMKEDQTAKEFAEDIKQLLKLWLENEASRSGQEEKDGNRNGGGDQPLS